MARRAARAGAPLVLVFLLGCAESETPPQAGASACAEALPAPAEGFGSRGPHPVSVTRLPNPGWPGLEVSVFRPADAEAPVPAVFFAHANRVGDPRSYRALLEHAASRGLGVVFVPYDVPGDRHEDRYAALWSGFEAAAERLGEEMDLSRWGFVGHSYGAGAFPWIARRALVERGWGGRGAFALLLAPWYTLAVEPDDWSRLPSHLQVLVQVFEDDTATDHRIAIELFRALPLPPAHTNYVLVRSDRSGRCALPAVHSVPQSRGFRARDDALDSRAVFRLLDALVASAFDGDPEGRALAFPKGVAGEIPMGRWPDGVPVAPLTWSRHPEPTRPESDYLFPHSEASRWARYGAEPTGDAGPGGDTRGP